MLDDHLLPLSPTLLHKLFHVLSQHLKQDIERIGGKLKVALVKVIVFLIIKIDVVVDLSEPSIWHHRAAGSLEASEEEALEAVLAQSHFIVEERHGILALTVVHRLIAELLGSTSATGRQALILVIHGLFGMFIPQMGVKSWIGQVGLIAKLALVVALLSTRVLLLLLGG